MRYLKIIPTDVLKNDIGILNQIVWETQKCYWSK